MTNQHIRAWGFLAVMLLPLLAVLMVLGWQEKWKHEAKERLEKEQHLTVFIPEGGLVWEKKGKELRINGHFFDLASLKKTACGYEATGIWDHQEKAIERALATDRQEESLLYLFCLPLLGSIQAMNLQRRLMLLRFIRKRIKIYLRTRHTLVLSPPPKGYLL